MVSRTRQGGCAEGTDAPTPDALPAVEVTMCGLVDRPVTLGTDALSALEWTDVEADYRCASGRRWGGRWRGPSVAAVLNAGAPAGRVTHVRLVDDGYAACVPVRTLLDDGVLALADGDGPLDAERAPRFVHPEVGSDRVVKGVERVEAVALGPSEDRRDHERLTGRGAVDAQSPSLGS